MDRSTVIICVDQVRAETDKAYLFVVDGAEYWIPKSQLDQYQEIEVGDEGIDVEMSEWIADQKGLI